MRQNSIVQNFGTTREIGQRGKICITSLISSAYNFFSDRQLPMQVGRNCNDKYENHKSLSPCILHVFLQMLNLFTLQMITLAIDVLGC